MATPLRSDTTLLLTNIWSPQPHECSEGDFYPPLPLQEQMIDSSSEPARISLRELKAKKLLPKDLFIEIFRNK